MQENLSAPTLKVECSKWAKKFAKRFRNDASLQFYAFKPALGTQANFLGNFTDKSGNFFSPIPAWQWHIAVKKNGKLHDEIHPAGVEVDEYLLYFECLDCITVTFHPDLASALASARG